MMPITRFTPSPILKVSEKKRYMKTTRKPLQVVSSGIQPYEVVSHGIVYFTLFYCTMNWNYYRNMRIKAEQKTNLKHKNDKKNNNDK